MSCEPTLAGMWTKSEEVSKSHGSSESSFSTKVKRRAEAKVEENFGNFKFQTLENEKWKFVRVTKEKFWKFLGMFWGSKTKV